MTQFTGIVKVQRDTAEDSILVFNKARTIYRALEGEDAEYLVKTYKMGIPSKLYIEAETDEKGVLILGDQVDDQDW